MTGRDLIIYILSNNLENEEVFKEDGTFVGFITVSQAAVKMNVGVGTIYALISQGKLKYIDLGGKYFISEDCELPSNIKN